jgi:hypothetical protein
VLESFAELAAASAMSTFLPQLSLLPQLPS